MAQDRACETNHDRRGNTSSTAIWPTSVPSITSGISKPIAFPHYSLRDFLSEFE
jgi:hypothetical protein